MRVIKGGKKETKKASKDLIIMTIKQDHTNNTFEFGTNVPVSIEDVIIGCGAALDSVANDKQRFKKESDRKEAHVFIASKILNVLNVSFDDLVHHATIEGFHDGYQQAMSDLENFCGDDE